MSNNSSPLVAAVGYLRRSSDSDSQETSIEDQKQAVERYAEEKGYRILRWYTDDAISGDETEKREAFLRMVADARALGDFKAILCWDRKRFGRFNSIEYGYYVYPLMKARVYLATVNEGILDWNDATGRIVANVTQEGAHKDLIDHSANVVRGKLTAAEKGSWLGSPPYGYRIEGPTKNKRLVLGEPAHVRIVQRIFREFVEDGRSMHNLANRLNEEGFPSPGGVIEGWRYDTVGTILENPAYTGDYASCRFSYGKYHTVEKGKVAKSNGRCRRPENEWIVKRDHHEPIIDRRTWEKVQAMLAKGKPGRGPHTAETNPYLLTCLLRCGKCGAVLPGLTNKKFNYYQCGNRSYNGQKACVGTTVREDRVLFSIADHLNQEFLTLDGLALGERATKKELGPGDLPKAFAKVKELVSPPGQPAVDRKRLQKQADALAAKIDKAKGNLVHLDPEFIPDAQREIKRLQHEKEQLEAELRKRPSSEKEVNAEALDVLNNLYWLAHLFGAAAQEAWIGGDTPEDWQDWCAENPGCAYMIGAGKSPELRQLIRKISGITVHTRVEGLEKKVRKNTRVRHIFQGGEIEFVGQASSGGHYGKVEPSSPD